MGIARIEAKFAALKSENKSAFVTYIMAGDPDLETSFEILKDLTHKGADIIELGFPFSDPMAEGPTIQLAAERALKGGMRIHQVFELVKRFRTFDQSTPLILMGYMNPVESMGYAAFAAALEEAGADGALIVDCPPEEASGLILALDDHELALIRLITPTSDEARLKTLIKGVKGFIYYVSVAGVTGVKSAEASDVEKAVKRIKALSDLPVCVGFGIKSEDQARNIAKIADGAVVGSALIDEIKNSLSQKSAISTKVLEKVEILAHSVHSARI